MSFPSFKPANCRNAALEASRSLDHLAGANTVAGAAAAACGGVALPLASRRRLLAGLAGGAMGGLLTACGGGGGDEPVATAGGNASSALPNAQIQGAVREVAGLTPNSLGAAAENARALQAELGAGGVSLRISQPGVYCIASTIRLYSNTELEISEGVVLVKLEDALGATNLFTNSNHAGGNTSIRLFGRGALYFNANSYSAVYAANAVDCPVLPPFMNTVPGHVYYSSLMPYMNGLHFENVDRLVVDGLTLMMASKYNLYGAMLTNFQFLNLRIYGDDVVNPANASTYGRDGIHLQGNTSKGTIRGISGCVNDDGIALNVRDIPAFTTVRSVGPITDVLLEDITIKNQRRGGSAVHLYAGRDTRLTPKDTPPAITALSQTGRTVTVTCSGPHKMSLGAAFDITGASPAGYNISFGRVLSVPTPESFTYVVPSGQTAYVAGAQLTRYFQMSGITVRRVRGDCQRGPVINMSVTTDTANYGVLDGVTIEDCSGILRSANGSGIIGSSFVRLVDLAVRRCFTQNSRMAPLMETTWNGTRLVGTTHIEDCYTLTPYMPSSATGQTWIQLGNYESVLMSGGHATIEDGGGGWVQAISCGSPGGTLKISGFKLETSVPGGTAYLLRPLLSPDFGLVSLDNCWWPASAVLCHIDGTSTNGSVVLTNNVAPVGARALVNYYGQNAVFSFQGNDLSDALQGLVGAWRDVSSGTFVGSGNLMGHAPLFHRTSDPIATGASIVNGIDFRVDVTRIARANGSIVTNTNAAAGTLGTTGPVVCIGTEQGSWRSLAGGGSGSY